MRTIFFAKRNIIPLVILVAAATFFGCSSSGSTKAGATSVYCGNLGHDVTNEQKTMQFCDGAYMQQTHTGNWFPLASLHGPTAEMQNVAAREVRLADPNKIGYFYGLSTTGQVMLFATIRGKVSSTGSQLTNTDNAIGGQDSSGLGGTVVASPGDDGTFGPEECQGEGVFFFTADTDAMGTWCGPWSYFDAPIKLSTVPLMVTGTAAPTTPIPENGTTKK